jgi:vitamin B12 transport system permease protein
MNPRALLGAVFAAFCAAMLGLAAGAVWMLLAVSFGQVLPWLALPAGWLLATAMRHWVCPGQRASAAVLAAAATLLAAVYVSVLIAAARIAGSLGIGLVDALRIAGAPMLLELARLGMSTAQIVWFLAGAALAAAMAWRPWRQAAAR